MSNYITDFLRRNHHIGSANGIKAADLLSGMGRDTSEDGKRQLKAEIRRYRVLWRETDGVDSFIFSDTENGYYLTDDLQEATHFVNTQKSRAVKAFETAKFIRKYLRDNGELGKGA